ncbi:MAG: hypothetical protein IAE85_05025 [Anaerolinea sp.]|nr:hypothetical protein [Anaerolinea sp.]
MKRLLIILGVLAGLLVVPGGAQARAPVPVAHPPAHQQAIGDPLHTTYFSRACGTGGTGIAFDGQYLWYDCFPGSTLHKADARSGALLLTLTPNIDGDLLATLAWDRNRQKLWAGAARYGVTNVYLIDPTTGAAALVFSLPTLPFLPETLAYDPEDDTLYVATYKDENSEFAIFRFDASGAQRGSWFLGYHATGLAVAGDLLYIAHVDYIAGEQFITAYEKTTGAFQFQFPTNTGNDFDLECDSVTFAPRTVLWAVYQWEPRQATAYEIPDAQCPGGVRNLASTPGPQSQDVVLTWKAPDAGGAAAAAYDIRYSDAPLDWTTWSAAVQVQGEPPPGAPDADETLTLPNLSNGVRRYFALKFQYPGGGWSPLSNVPSLLDTGFRPPVNGYSFPNFGDVQDGDLTFEDMAALFDSQSAVCYNPIGPCMPRVPAAQWRAMALTYMQGGHCAGMSVTSLRFFKGLDVPNAIQPGALTAYDLSKPNARNGISYYWALELLDPVGAARNAQRARPPSDTLDQTLAALAGAAPDPLNLDVYQGTSGHAITPFAVEERKDDWRVWVYNNNFPNVRSAVLITTTTENWSYSMGGGLGVWSGDAGAQSLAVYPISTFAQTPECPWCLFSQVRGAQSQAANGQLWLTGGHGLMTDSQGRRIGYVGAQFVNEIPGASANFAPGGLGVAMQPIYTLPLTETYSILLDGQMLTRTQTASVVQFGPGYASGAQEIPIRPETQDRLLIAADGSQVIYRASSDKEVTLLLTTDSATEGYQFRFEGVDMAVGQPATGTVDAANGLLLYDNRKAGGSEYDIAVRRADGTGERAFVHRGIQAAATDIHYLKYAAWDGDGALTLLIDRGGDGTMDDTVQLANQLSHRLYLPGIHSGAGAENRFGS